MMKKNRMCLCLSVVLALFLPCTLAGALTEQEAVDILINDVIDLGQQVSIIPKDADGSIRGSWTGIEIDPEDSQLTGVAPPYYNGDVLGY